MRIYDFEDIAIEKTYKYVDFESEDVEMKNNFNSCYNY
jgi:hypothetical protein